ncbi:VOC family protein [Clostridium beijerinckii]|uniref:Catechol 2,3-dioxygenase-like lactoylglutathione lyase family enzyme n=1 Tax=Clostridium beijerinckii TaxID=1520 RepID=A0AAX0BAR6_CLOBE|nr:VOC family protein [Clostridium beijerinckii]NRT92046.1 catechol 2,3-dioxygenase-like lactoylglutathione lyase family enzyme [Clostridium beijerinckii]NYC71573.1 catechol 2,3-dioxygenase-like lactoylglutathione lyase family enzyme [Clostridium beijerinckii]
MKFSNPMMVVSNMEKSKKFYYEVLGLEVVVDFGANVTLTGGVALQTKDTWLSFIGKQNDEIAFGGNAAELYFEEDDFDSFIQNLNIISDINYVHPMVEHSWGQRVVRFYDPDKHIIEVGENIVMVVKRFLNSGLSIEETAIRMDVPVDYIESCLK